MTSKKDWVGGKKAVFTTLGASNHVDSARADDDYYATDPIAAEHLARLEKLNINIWEPACGAGHLSKVFEALGHSVLSTDLVDRGYGVPGADFLSLPKNPYSGDIVTNPPYKFAEEFVRQGLDLLQEGNKLCLFLKLTFLEGKARAKLFYEHPPARVWVSSSRIACAPNGDFSSIKSSAAAYAWFIWIKGNKAQPTIGWF